MTNGEEDTKMHQLHIAIPMKLQEELKKILPEYGAITSLTRNFLIHFVRNYNNMAPGTESPFDKTVRDMTDKALLKRSSGGDSVTGD